MRKICLLISCVMLATVIFSFHPTSTFAADYTATVNISTTSPKEIDLGMTGPHNELSGSAYRWDNPELIDRVNAYDRMGFVRINGTNLNVYDWKTGSVGEEALGQLSSDDKHYYGYMKSGRMVETKGGETLEDLREFLQRTGTKVIIPVNVFTNTMHQIGNMAKYAYENHIPVLYFELGNEVSFYTAEVGLPRSHRFKTGTDYLNRMIAFDREIKNSYPGAKTVVAMSNDRKLKFDEDFKNFPDPFWDAITFHRFVGNGPDFPSAMINANQGLNSWDTYINHYLDNSSPSSPIIIGEHSTALSGILSLTHYNGIVVAENMLRLSKHPNVDHIQSWRIPLGIGRVSNDYTDKMQDAYQRSLKIDTNTLDFDFYDTAPAVSARVVDGALNNSTAAWTTTLTGGTTVQTSDTTTMPALHSQAYRGTNGKDYLVIVNKSSSTHDVTVKKDDVNVNQTMTRTYVTAVETSTNSATSTPVYTQTATVNAGDPVFIPAYSVTRVEWTRTTTPEVPPIPWFSHADAQNNQVDLKWHHSNNATGYNIKYGTDPNNLTNVVDVGNVTSYSVTGLTNGSTYYFGVAAYNLKGTSLYSNLDPSNNVFVKLEAPDAPLIRKSHYEKNKRAVIEWKSVPDATGYKLKYGTSSGTYTDVIDVGNNIGYIVDSLINGQSYYFVVSAYNGRGESVNSTEVSVTPRNAVPLAPHNLTITDETSTSISLKWTGTKAPRQVHYFENGNTNWNDVLGTWSVVDHPDTTRATKVYKSPNTTGTAMSIFENVSVGDQEGEARIEINGSYGSDSQAGVVARYTNNNNYYKFVYDSEFDKFRLIKRYLANFTVLTEIARTADQDPTDMVLRLDVNGNKLIPRLDSKAIFIDPIIDSNNPLTGGNFGIITISQEAYFDEVRLRKELGTVNVYRSTNPHLNFTLRASGVIGNTWSENSLNSSKTYYYRVTAESNTYESYGHSNTVMKD
jgi:hypothetical protein